MGEFGELLKFTLIGYIIGIILAILLDNFEIKQNPVGEWAVRTITGEGESIFEGLYALKHRLHKKSMSMAEAYGWGKLIGMLIPGFIDFASRFFGINVYGWEGFYIPYFYAMGDQIGANISGFIYLYGKERSLNKAITSYFKNPIMLSSLAVLIIVPVGLLTARLIGFSPDKNIYVALETIAANLCWVPPLVGYILEKKNRSE